MRRFSPSYFRRLVVRKARWNVQVNDLKNVARVIMGGTSYNEAIGNDPQHYVFIEADGEMEGLDNLRACREGAFHDQAEYAPIGFFCSRAE